MPSPTSHLLFNLVFLLNAVKTLSVPSSPSTSSQQSPAPGWSVCAGWGDGAPRAVSPREEAFQTASLFSKVAAFLPKSISASQRESMGVSPLVSLRRRFNFRGWIRSFWKGRAFQCGGQMKELCLTRVPDYSLGQGLLVWGCRGLYPAANWCELLSVGGSRRDGGAPAPSPASGAAPPASSSSPSIPKRSVFPAGKSQPGAAAALPTVVARFGRVYRSDAQARTSSSQQRSYSSTRHVVLREGFEALTADPGQALGATARAGGHLLAPPARAGSLQSPQVPGEKPPQHAFGQYLSNTTRKTFSFFLSL